MLFSSLTVRLPWLFAALVTIAGTLVGVHAYYALKHQLLARDAAAATGKLTQVEHLLREADSYEALAKNIHQLDDVIRGHDGLTLQLLRPDNTILYDVASLPQLPKAVNDYVAIPTAAIQLKRTVNIGNHGDAATVVVGQDGVTRIGILRHFRINLIAGVVLSAALLAAIAWLLTRRELSATRQLVRQVNRIGVEQLNYRLVVPARPSEMKEIASAFNAMLQRLESGYQHLYQFSADLAHDLRTPLTNLIGHTEVALSKVRRPEEYQSVLELSLDEYQRLSRMIESMLFLARADRAAIEVRRERLDLYLELSKTAKYFAVLASEKVVSIQVQACGYLFADSMLFRRAVNNLVANAVTHCPASETITISGFLDRSSVIVQVDNPGTAIPAEERERIFDRFYRSDAARSNSSWSTGLGLPIVQSIMSLHGGTASVVGTEDRRTRFELRFPQGTADS